MTLQEVLDRFLNGLEEHKSVADDLNAGELVDGDTAIVFDLVVSHCEQGKKIADKLKEMMGNSLATNKGEVDV